MFWQMRADRSAARYTVGSGAWTLEVMLGHKLYCYGARTQAILLEVVLGRKLCFWKWRSYGADCWKRCSCASYTFGSGASTHAILSETVLGRKLYYWTWCSYASYALEVVLLVRKLYCWKRTVEAVLFRKLYLWTWCSYACYTVGNGARTQALLLDVVLGHKLYCRGARTRAIGSGSRTQAKLLEAVLFRKLYCWKWCSDASYIVGSGAQIQASIFD